MNKKRCLSCGCKLSPKKHILNQKYCSNTRCQNIRKINWRRDKLKRDKKYRLNKKAAQDKWKAKNPDYWKIYRARISSNKISKKKIKKSVLKIALPKSILVNLPKSGSIKSDCQVVFRFT